MLARESVILDKLRECKEGIPQWRQQRVDVIETAAFQSWMEEHVARWLRVGGQATSHELKSFRALLFCDNGPREPGAGFDSADQRQYLEDLQRADLILNAAIENLSTDMSFPPDPARPSHKGRGTTTIHNTGAGTVVVGDGSSISIANINMADVLKMAEHEVEKLPDTPEKRSFLKILREVTRHPMARTLTAVALEEAIRHSHLFG